MIRTKLGILGFCTVIFGPMAFDATGAQAAGTWIILNAESKEKTATELPAVLEFEKDKSFEFEHYILHTEIIKIKVLFLCTTIKAVNARLLPEGNIGEKPTVVANSKVLFSGCETILNGVPSPECRPTDPEEGSGVIVTKPLHAAAVLHELTFGIQDDILIVLPDVGQLFATVTFPENCLFTTIPINGELALLDGQNLALTHLIKHLLQEFLPLSKLWAITNTVEHRVSLLGGVWALLGGEHINRAWSIHNL